MGANYGHWLFVSVEPDKLLTISWKLWNSFPLKLLDMQHPEITGKTKQLETCTNLIKPKWKITAKLLLEFEKPDTVTPSFGGICNVLLRYTDYPKPGSVI